MMCAMPAPVARPTLNTLADVAALESASRRTWTPCGDERMLWHEWGRGPAVLLLHGGAGSWTHWVRNVSALVASGRRVLAPDMPGFGDSAAPPGGHDADALPPWIERGMDTLAADEPFDLVGFSFGGLVAALLAAGAPARVKRLVLVGAPALTSELGPPLDLEPWSMLPVGPERDAAHRHNLAALMFADPATADDLALHLQMENVRRARLRAGTLPESDALIAVLPRVRARLFGIWGERDAFAGARVHDRETVLRRIQPGLEFRVIPGAGHWTPYEAPEAVTAAMTGMLAAGAPE